MAASHRRDSRPGQPLCLQQGPLDDGALQHQDFFFLINLEEGNIGG